MLPRHTENGNTGNFGRRDLTGVQEELRGRLTGAEAELEALGRDLQARDAEAAALARSLADARRALGSGGGSSKGARMLLSTA